MTLLINVYSTLREPPPREFSHALHGERDRSDPALLEHLQGFMGFVQQHTEEMTYRAYHLLRHIERVQRHYSLTVEEEAMGGFLEWAWQANAICFVPDGSIRDPDGRVLFSPAGEADDEAMLPFPPDAIERKERTDRLLLDQGIRVPTNIPPIAGAGEVELRAAIDVAARTLALFIVAVKAEGLAHGHHGTAPVLEVLGKSAWKGLTPAEQAFERARTPPQQDVVNFLWRYEAIFLLHWALGLVDELPYPSAICDVPALAERVVARPAEEFIAAARLRPVGAILEALDQHFRWHWAARQAHLDQQPPPGNLDLSVITERHHALNWLVRFEDRDWDDVDTPT